MLNLHLPERFGTIGNILKGKRYIPLAPLGCGEHLVDHFYVGSLFPLMPRISWIPRPGGPHEAGTLAVKTAEDVAEHARLAKSK